MNELTTLERVIRQAVRRHEKNDELGRNEIVRLLMQQFTSLTQVQARAYYDAFRTPVPAAPNTSQEDQDLRQLAEELGGVAKEINIGGDWYCGRKVVQISADRAFKLRWLISAGKATVKRRDRMLAEALGVEGLTYRQMVDQVAELVTSGNTQIGAIQ